MLSGGGLFCERPHVLTRDGSLLLVCCVDSVLAFSTVTGEQLYRLQHAVLVTALCLHPHDDVRLYTACSDGQLAMWDLATGSIVQTWELDSHIESLAVGDAGCNAGQHACGAGAPLTAFGMPEFI